MKQIMDYLEQCITAVREEVEPQAANIESLEFEQLTTLYYQLRKLKEIAEEFEKISNVVMPNLAVAINKQMVAMGLESLEKKFDGVSYKLTPDIRYFISANADDKPLLLEWLKNHDIGKEIVKEDVHPKTLESFVKGIIEAGELPPPMVKVHSQEVLTFRKLPAKKV